MNRDAFYIRSLIDSVRKETKIDGVELEDFDEMAEELFVRTKRRYRGKYLKYDLYGGKSPKPQKAILNALSKFIGHDSYRSFVDSIRIQIDPLLESMVGDYYCYVRMNMQKGRLLRSPVKIFMAGGKISYRLKGGRLDYEGELKKQGQCLFVLMEAGKKSFYHVYRIGEEPSPQTLQGVFSGVSYDFKPIGGRAVLIRAEEPFERLATGKLEIDTMAKSKKIDERELAAYFKDRGKNNLTLNSTASSGIRDLNEP